MKVLHITYDMRIGGTEMVIKNIIEGFADNDDYEMGIFCIEGPLGPWGEELSNRGIRIAAHHRRPGFDITLIRVLRDYIKTHQIDIVHCHQYTPWVYGVMAAVFTKTKVIFTEHGRFYPDSSSWKRRFINPILVKLTDRITTISNATKQALADFEFIPARKVSVIYNGISPLEADHQKIAELKQSLGLPPDAVIVGTIARLDPIKNQTMMIKAFARVAEQCPRARLIIVGDGEEKSALEALVNQLALKEKVIFTGYIAKPVNHMALMDIFLLSSFSEGTSMTLLEALSLGIPSVVTNVGGNPEIIQSEIGAVTANDDSEDFADAILQLVEQTPSSYKMACQQHFAANFSQQTMNQAYEVLYQELTQ